MLLMTGVEPRTSELEATTRPTEPQLRKNIFTQFRTYKNRTDLAYFGVQKLQLTNILHKKHYYLGSS